MRYHYQERLTPNDSSYLILEFVPNGELFEHLVKKGRLPMEEALQYFQQIISAVDYCHRFNIAHRDLKPENLLLDSDNNIKVADFGMAAWEGGDNMLETSCGSPHYASPEVVRGETYRGYKSDIWSCGVILYALLVGRLPFDDQKISRLLEKVKKGDFSMPRDIPLAAQDLLSRMLEKDVDKRITIAQILVHPWFTCRPLKSIPGLVPNAPTLEEVNRPVMSVEDIDSDIFANIRTLWHGASESETIDRLMSKEYVKHSHAQLCLTNFIGKHGRRLFITYFSSIEQEDLRITMKMSTLQPKQTQHPLLP